MTYSMAIQRTVYDEDEGVSVTIRPSPDNPDGYTEITTAQDARSIEYYGEVRLTLPNGMARLLGRALLEQTKTTCPPLNEGLT